MHGHIGGQIDTHFNHRWSDVDIGRKSREPCARLDTGTTSKEGNMHVRFIRVLLRAPDSPLTQLVTVITAARVRVCARPPAKQLVKLATALQPCHTNKPLAMATEREAGVHTMHALI
jgi:hypothetical protein